MLLTLPTLAPEVPAQISFGGAGRSRVQLALGMSQAGLIRAGDLSRLHGGAVDIDTVDGLIESVWKREIGDLYALFMLRCEATLLVGLEADQLPGHCDGREGYAVVFDNQYDPEWFVVGPALTRLEARGTGLAYTALVLLDFALSMGDRPFTPLGALEMCQWMYWEGEEDESVVAADPDTYGDDIAKRAEIFGLIPEWALGKGVKLLSPCKLARLAKTHADTPDGPLLKALAELAKVIVGRRKSGAFADAPDDGPRTAPMAVVRWDENDLLHRVFDDYWQYAQQGEQDAYTGFIRFDTSAAGISEALKRTRQTGLVLKATDNVLQLLHTGVLEH